MQDYVDGSAPIAKKLVKEIRIKVTRSIIIIIIIIAKAFFFCSRSILKRGVDRHGHGHWRYIYSLKEAEKLRRKIRRETEKEIFKTKKRNNKIERFPSPSHTLPSHGLFHPLPSLLY